MNYQLLKKLLRDLWHRKGSLGALSFVGVLGISFMVSMYGVYFDLRDSRDNFYRDFALADFRISAKAVPENFLPLLAEEAGVAALAGEVALEGRTELDGFADPIQTTLVGVPPKGKDFNKLLTLQSGDSSPLQYDHVFASSAFYREHSLKRGSTLSVVLLGQRQSFKVDGSAQSPEWVYVLAPGGGLAPDPLRTAVLYAPIRQLQEAGELENSYNQISGRFTDDVRGRPEREKEVLDRLERRLQVYGVTEAIPRSQFMSVQFLDSDITGLKISASIMPSLCLIIVAVVLNVVIGRLVASQRTVVGTLKALGYSTPAISFHYLGFGLIVGLVGAVAGTALGLWMQGGLLDLYRSVYELPIREPGFYPDLIALSVGLSLLFAVLGTAFGVRSATRLTPAAAMRPPPPEKGGRILFERGPFKLLWDRFPFTWKLVLRAVFRNPFRSAVTLGSSFVATTIMVQSLAMGDTIGVLIDKEFRTAQKQDVTVVLREPRNRISVSREFENLPGVLKVEPQLSVPAIMVATDVSGAPERQVVVQGLPQNPQLENPLRLTPRLADGLDGDEKGIFLARKLGEILQLGPGSQVELQLRRGTRRRIQTRVAGLVDTNLGLGAYANVDQLSRMVGEQAVTDKLNLLVDLEQRKALVRELRRRPEVLNVTWRADSLAQMEQVLQQNLGTMLTVTIGFCGFLAFGAVLNTALVAVSEREREVGTLRVLGYTPIWVTAIFSGESILLNSVGVISGWAGGAGLTYFISRAYDTEIFRFPFVFNAKIVLFGTVIMMSFLLASQVVLAFIVRGLNWLDVLKIRE